ncbi:MAG TPA: hypothetical protein DCZ01_10160 [Elusimicrobia bacterium]|nr:MAG: hypothetical protein A2X37_07200 [Elusimicrobia bacterium GWA2_66_18]HAZ08862.1 hypothetical protein [Elusimicrobiota bacterium]
MKTRISRLNRLLRLFLGTVPLLNSMAGVASAQDGSKVYGTPDSAAPTTPSRKDLLRLSLSKADIPPGAWDTILAIAQLAEDVFADPAAAARFSHDPQRYLASIGAGGVALNPNSPEVRIALALGDAEVREAVQANNPEGFLVALERRGLLKTLNASEIAAKLGDLTIASEDGMAVAVTVAYLITVAVSTAAATVNVVAVATVAVYAAAVVKTAGATARHLSDAPPFALGRAMGGDDFGVSVQETFIREQVESLSQAIEKMAAFRELKPRISGSALRRAVRQRLYKQVFGKSFGIAPEPTEQ